MALAATGVTAFAVVAKGFFFNNGHCIVSGAFFQHRVVTGQGRVQTVVVIVCVRVALVAGFGGYRFSTHTFVGCLFVIGYAIAIMAGNAAHLAVNSFRKFLIA